MEPERLAAYVAGELDPDERAAVEARLAGDPGLRAEVQRLRRVEDALGRLPRARPAPGFEDRLEQRLSPILDETLAAGPEGAAPSPVDAAPATAPRAWAAGGDELAARRRVPRWVPALGGAAAGVALLAVLGTALLDLPVAGPDEAAMDAAPESDDAEDGEAAEDLESMAADEDGPVVVASDRALDDDAVDALTAEARLQRLRGRGLGGEEGRRLAGTYAQRLQAAATADSLQPRTHDADRPSAEEEGPVTEEEGPVAEDAAPEAPDPERAAARCLDAVLADAGDPPPIPAYVELVRVDDEAALAYGLVTASGPADRYDRVEVWVVSREDCEVLEFRQDDD